VGVSEASTELSGRNLLDLLINEFCSRTDITQRVQLLKYLNNLNLDLLRFSGPQQSGSALHIQLAWKRELVGQLVSMIKRPKRVAAALV